MKNKMMTLKTAKSTMNSDEVVMALNSLSSEISDLKNDLKYYARKTETGMIHAAYSGMGDSALQMLSKGYEEEIRGVMGVIAGECPMREECSAAFSQLLSDMITDYRKGELDDAGADEYRQKITGMREAAPYPSCQKCFEKNEDLFNRSIKRCSAFQAFFSGRTPACEETPVQEINPENIVSSYLEPLANKHRFKVLQELYYGPKSFSELSEVTGLRGGNLLFHIEKLVGTTMILQKQERGVYVLSEKGANALKVSARLLT
ncbi:winged helix-turn-helix domain-containing protein [Methanoplanus endosymbiosus]|uniref:Winged helix-turn-helix domain-containing protein n=1 Tax=Methanoplanus endosymbiosus TaxID=33865 RepID=A0A9E7TMJ1_9EURY|nr:winged helix-turn-helix domain-containing protein [Methanoplanus endosymbiosus]UUX93316.1 winged helix-turn-helix domain-containing protein [Methanoplanus endosymbiosus]